MESRFVRSDADECAIGLFDNLRNSVGAIPFSLVEATEELATAAPELFHKVLVRRVQMGGPDFSSPTSATEFAEILNQTVQGRNGERVI